MHKQVRMVPGHSFEKATRTGLLCGIALRIITRRTGSDRYVFETKYAIHPRRNGLICRAMSAIDSSVRWRSPSSRNVVRKGLHRRDADCRCELITGYYLGNFGPAEAERPGAIIMPGRQPSKSNAKRTCTSGMVSQRMTLSRRGPSVTPRSLRRGCFCPRFRSTSAEVPFLRRRTIEYVTCEFP